MLKYDHAVGNLPVESRYRDSDLQVYIMPRAYHDRVRGISDYWHECDSKSSSLCAVTVTVSGCSSGILDSDLRPFKLAS